MPRAHCWLIQIPQHRRKLKKTSNFQAVHLRAKSTHIQTNQGAIWVLSVNARQPNSVTMIERYHHNPVADGIWFFPSGKSVAVVSHMLHRISRGGIAQTRLSSTYKACSTTSWISNHCCCASRMSETISPPRLSFKNRRLSQTKEYSSKAYSRRNSEAQRQRKSPFEMVLLTIHSCNHLGTRLKELVKNNLPNRQLSAVSWNTTNNFKYSAQAISKFNSGTLGTRKLTEFKSRAWIATLGSFSKESRCGPD